VKGEEGADHILKTKKGKDYGKKIRCEGKD